MCGAHFERVLCSPFAQEDLFWQHWESKFLYCYEMLCVITSWARCLMLSCNTMHLLKSGIQTVFVFVGFANVGVRRFLPDSAGVTQGPRGPSTLEGHKLLLRKFLEEIIDLLCCWGICFPGVHGVSWSACVLVWFYMPKLKLPLEYFIFHKIHTNLLQYPPRLDHCDPFFCHVFYTVLIYNKYYLLVLGGY